jgi:hypothetical protein
MDAPFEHEVPQKVLIKNQKTSKRAVEFYLKIKAVIVEIHIETFKKYVMTYFYLFTHKYRIF